MIELVKRLGELCPEWCMTRNGTDFHVVSLKCGWCSLLPAFGDVDNAAAIHAIVERMVEKGWAVNRYCCCQHGVMVHDCELVWPDDSRDTIETVGDSEAEAVMKAAVAAFGEGKE